MSHYRITPKEKKSIRNIYELSRENEDGSSSWFNIIELYRSGKGFLNSDTEDNLPAEGDNVVYCDTRSGENECSDLDDTISIDFEFSDDISVHEQKLIEEAYSEDGASWVYEGDHDWIVENDYLEIDSPYEIDLVDEDGTFIRNIV